MKGLFRKSVGTVVTVLALTTPTAVAATPAGTPAAPTGTPAAPTGTPATPTGQPSTSGSQAAASNGGTQTSAPINCPSGQFSQPFLAWHDRHWYTLLPGESADSFDGTGWQLSGGAHLSTATLRDKTDGQVLDLPSKATAVSPVVCVNSAYPQARTLIADPSGSQGVAVYVSFYKNGKWGPRLATGNIKSPKRAWAASVPIRIHAQSLKAQTPMRFYLVATGKHSLYQVYNFYLDPRLSW